MEKIAEKCQHSVYPKPIIFQLISAYYIATPVFFVIELLWGISFRVPFFLTEPIVRYGYYAICLICGIVCYFRPKTTPVIALVESTINVILLFVGYWKAVVGSITVVAERESIPAILTLKGVLSFVVPASVWVVSFYYCQNVMDRMMNEKMKF